jgi:UDP-GlcNAc:undecaprenyl-phosphate GlcNAc-1-phosphate transferase
MITALDVALLFGAALMLSLLLTPVAKLLGVRLKILDMPGRLSIHAEPTPRTGGLAMFAALAVTVALWVLIGEGFDGGEITTALVVIVGGAMIGAVGLLGDMGRIPSKVEFALQFIPALLVVILGVRVGFIPFAFLAIPLSLFYLVGGACAMNLLDGMDGLAAGATAVASVFFAVAGVSQGNLLVAVLAIGLVGSTLGFLVHNFHPASVFMGDVGSLFLGFTLATLAVLLTSRPYDFELFVGSVLIFGVPILDTSLAIARRVLGGREIISGDRDHLYDRLHARGLGVRSTVLLVYGLGALMGLTGFLILR